jgi:hypothetical protein
MANKRTLSPSLTIQGEEVISVAPGQVAVIPATFNFGTKVACIANLLRAGFPTVQCLIIADHTENAAGFKDLLDQLAGDEELFAVYDHGDTARGGYRMLSFTLEKKK